MNTRQDARTFADFAINAARLDRSAVLTQREQDRAAWLRRTEAALTEGVVDILGLEERQAEQLLTWSLTDTEPGTYMEAHAVIPADSASVILRWHRTDDGAGDRFEAFHKCGHCGHSEVTPVRSLADIGRLLDSGQQSD